MGVPLFEETEILEKFKELFHNSRVIQPTNFTFEEFCSSLNTQDPVVKRLFEFLVKEAMHKHNGAPSSHQIVTVAFDRQPVRRRMAIRVRVPDCPTDE